MATDQIVIEYVAQVEGLKAQLKSVQTELKTVQKTADDSAKNTSASFASVGSSIKNVATGIAASLGLAFSAQKVIQFAQESIKAFQESEAVAKKLEFAITRIGKEGVSAFERLNKQADIFAKKSIFDDESIRKSQTQLAQFGLQSAAIEKLIPQIIDLASATGMDLAQATDLAIAGINGQGRALKPYGIILDDTGDKTKNLAIVTEGLTKFTGSAAEAFNTAAGQAKFFDNQINELQESIGEKLSPIWEGLKIAALQSIETQINAFQDLLALAGSEEAEFSQRLNAFEQLSSESQTRITFDLAKKGTERTELEQRLFLEYRKILDARLEATEEEQKQELGLTQEGINKKLAAEKKLQEDRIKSREDALNSYNDVIKLLERWEFESAVAVTKKKKDELEKQQKDKEDALEWAENQEDEAEELRIKREEKEAQRKEEIRQAEFDFIATSANALFEYQNQLDDAQINNLDQSLKQGKISQETYDKQVAEIRYKAAKRDKEQALFNIAIDTAQAVVKAILAAPATFGLPFSAFALATGAIQAALVASRPIPKFAEGVIDLKGGVQGRDSIPALLMPGESVMTTEETRRHGELLRSIRAKKLDEHLMDNYINPKLSAILGNSTAENMAKSVKLNGLDEYAMGRAIRRNNGVNLQNADYLAKAIAREMRSDNIKRTWSA